MANEVLFEVRDGVGTITINRPEKHNALTLAMKSELQRLSKEIQEQPDVRVVILKGAGPSFCSGHDLSDPSSDPPFAVDSEFAVEQRRVRRQGQEYREMLWELPQPVIAQVHGYCLTNGLELAMNCDLVYAADDARFSMRSFGGSGKYYHLWPWTIGVRRTKELLFTGRWVSGAEAAQLGMINAALPAPELEAHVSGLAAQIAQVPLEWLANDKQACNKIYDLMGAAHGQDYAAMLHATSHLSEESKRLGVSIAAADWKEAVRRRDERLAR